MYPPTSYVLTYPSRYLGPCCNIYNFISARCHIYIGMLSTAHYTLPHACCQVFRCTLHIATSCMYCQLHIAIFSSPLCQVVNYILASFQVHIAKFTFPSFHVHIGKFSNAHCHVFKWTLHIVTCTLAKLSSAHSHVFMGTLPHAHWQAFKCTLPCFQMHITHYHMHICKLSSAHLHAFMCTLPHAH